MFDSLHNSIGSLSAYVQVRLKPRRQASVISPLRFLLLCTLALKCLRLPRTLKRSSSRRDGGLIRYIIHGISEILPVQIARMSRGDADICSYYHDNVPSAPHLSFGLVCRYHVVLQTEPSTSTISSCRPARPLVR